MKAIKNDIQIDHLKACHINDGIAMTKFMYWLKKNVGKIPMTERMISDHLEEERKKLPDYMGPSFETICAYKDHAAMMHYQSTEESDVDVKAEGMLLIDSGGQYYGGTTDVTRTFILGPISEEERKYFTLVLKSMLTLANAKFLFGCRGSNLDILAREHLWEDGVDYRCGTVLDIFLVFMKVQTLFVGDRIPKILTQYYSRVWSSQTNQVSMFPENTESVQKIC